GQRKGAIGAFAFGRGIEADANDNRIGLRGECFGFASYAFAGGENSEAGAGAAYAFVVFETDFVGMAGFKARRIRVERFGVRLPVVDDLLIVDEEAHAIVGGAIELVGSSFCRDESAGPAYREMIDWVPLGKAVITPLEIHCRVGASERGSSFQIFVVE